MKTINQQSLVKKITQHLHQKEMAGELKFTDSDMFIYCHFYTGNFWKNTTKNNKKAA